MKYDITIFSNMFIVRLYVSVHACVFVCVCLCVCVIVHVPVHAHACVQVQNNKQLLSLQKHKVGNGVDNLRPPEVSCGEGFCDAIVLFTWPGGCLLGLTLLPLLSLLRRERGLEREKKGEGGGWLFYHC